MHVNVVTVSVEDSVDPDRRGLREGVIPRVRTLPGFVAGYWLEPIDGKAMSMTVFASEEAARGAVAAMGLESGASPTPGVTVEHVETREVVGHA